MKIKNKVIDLTFFLIRKTAKPVFKTFWIKEVTGLENIPSKGPAILVFNHQSYFDFLCFLSISPRNTFFLTAEKFFKSKLWKPLMVLTGQIKVERLVRDKRNVHSKVSEYLKQGRMIGIFPEGTRSGDRENLAKGFPGAVKYAHKENVPLIPIGIIGTFDIMSRNDSRPSFKKIVQINIGKPMDFNRFNTHKLNYREFMLLTHFVMLEISKLSQKNTRMNLNSKTNSFNIAVFDLDGTIIRGQSQFLFLKFLIKKKVISSFSVIPLFVWFLFYKLKLVSKPDKAFDYALKIFKKNNYNDLSNLAADFVKSD